MLSGVNSRRLPAGAVRDRQNLIRVLEATLKLPMHGSQRPARRRPQTTIGLRRRRATTPIFSPERASPQGYLGLDAHLLVAQRHTCKGCEKGSCRCGGAGPSVRWFPIQEIIDLTNLVTGLLREEVQSVPCRGLPQ